MFYDQHFHPVYEKQAQVAVMKMIANKRFYFDRPDLVPATDEVLSHVTRERSVVLVFPASCGLMSVDLVVGRLTQEAPENIFIYDACSRGGKISTEIRETVSKASVLDMESEFIFAAQHFRRTATRLAVKLANQNDISPGDLWAKGAKVNCNNPEWHIFFHGEHLCFKHRESGQTVEVNLWFGTEFGVLDPEFFYQYMETTPGLEPPVDLRDRVFDTQIVMDILEARGKLVRIVGPYKLTGLTAGKFEDRE